MTKSQFMTKKGVYEIYITGNKDIFNSNIILTNETIIQICHNSNIKLIHLLNLWEKRKQNTDLWNYIVNHCRK
jgi:hypothetical protein